MTVTNKKAHPVLTSLGTLLQPEETGGEPQLKTAALANKVATASKVLATTPSLHALALEVVSNGLLFQCSLYDHSPQLAQEGSLATSLSEVWSLLESLLSHCPQGWSSKLFKWSVSLLGRFSISYKSPTSPEEATRAWLNNPLLAPVHSFIKRCADYLVGSGMGLHCMECLFPACSMHAPNLNWLLAHVVSLHPSSLMPVLLHHTLSTPPSSNPSTDPGFTTLTQALTHLSRTHKDTLRDCIVSLVTDLLSSANRPELHKILFLLRVASECPPVLEIAAAQCLEKLNPASIQDLLVQSIKLLSSGESHDSYEGRGGGSDEEDEGEIVSDDEEMQVDSNKPPMAIRGDEVVQLIANLVCQLKGSEACVAINKVIDTHARVENYLKTQEEAMEEGEIVHNSTGKAVAESCKSLMVEILTRMHSSACLPHLIPGQASPKAPPTGQGQSQGGDGCGLELTIGLQCGLEQWCRRLLDLVRESSSNSLGLTCSWLQEVITCVCVCSSEFQAASAMAQLLSLSTDTHQLSKVLEVYWELQVRHSHLAHTTVQAAISSAQHQMTTPTGDCWIEDGEMEGMENGNGGGRMENGSTFSSQEEDEMFGNFISNVMVVLKERGRKRGRAGDEQHLYDITAIRSQFQSALSEQVLYLTQLLSPSLLLLYHTPQDTNKRHLLLLFDLIYSVLNPQQGKQNGRPSSSSSPTSPQVVIRLSSQSLCRVLQALLSHYFSMMKMAALSILKSGGSDLAMEAALGKCRRLIVWCTTYNYPSLSPSPSHSSSSTSASSASSSHSSSTTVLAYSTILDAMLSKDLNHYFSVQTLTKVQSSSVKSSGRLLSTNSHLGLSTLHGAKQSTRRVYHTGSLQLRNQKTSVENNKDFAQPSVTHTLCQLMQLLQALTSANKDTLASVLLDKLAPHATELKQWPDEESLKHCLEWDLTVKRQLDNNPVLWELLLFVSEGGRETSSLSVCAPVVRALLTVLGQHWQRCRVNKTTMFPKELASSVSLVECLARAEWLPRPLCYVGELFSLITPTEAHLLLTAVHTYLKGNYANIKSKHYHLLEDTGYHEVVKGVLVKNIQHFGSQYARYIISRNDKSLPTK